MSDVDRKPSALPYVHFAATYDATTLARLERAVKKSLARAQDEYALERDEQVFTRSICRRGSFRYDLRLPPRSVGGCRVLPQVRSAIEALLGNDIVSRPPHCLVAFCGAEAQQWHTDVEPLFDADVATPSFYMTLITALVDDVDNEAMGPTEFAVDGHKALLKRNESILFDGLAVHRGGAAQRDRPPLLYQVFHRSWYRDVNE